MVDDRRSHGAPSVGQPDGVCEFAEDEDYDFVPDFQRISVSGEHTTGVCLIDQLPRTVGHGTAERLIFTF